MKQWRICTASAVLLTIATAVGANAAPRPSMQDGWLAWEGCWHAPGDAQDHLVCIVSEGSAARMIEFSGAKALSESHIYTDGVPRTVTREGCTGTEQARWSEDQQRIFLVSDMKCGENISRKVSGIMSMKTSNEWLSVQAVTTVGPAVTRTRHYTAVPLTEVPQSVVASLQGKALATETARYTASQPVDLSDVTEALRALHQEVVINWLTELGQPFDLDGRKLVMLADAGVPAPVIDVLVAVSNPEHFAVRDANRSQAEPYWARGGGRVYDPCWGYSRTSIYSPFDYGYGYGYSPYGSGYGYGYGCGYTPFGYDPWGWRIAGRTVVVVRGSPEDDGARVTRNGYTSGTSKGKARPRDNTSVSPSSERSGSATVRPSSGSSGSSKGSASGSSSSGGSSSGRTAKPRDKD